MSLPIDSETQDHSDGAADDKPDNDDSAKTCTYCNEALPKWSPHPICKQCRVSIKENQKELELELQEQPVGNLLLLAAFAALAVIAVLGFLASIVSSFF